MAQTKRNSPPTDAAARVDADLVTRAYRKKLERQELTAQERAALKRHERDKEEQLRWKFYGSIPQKHYREMSGRPTKVLNEQAERYGIPCGGPAIDLSKLVRAYHDLLAKNAHRLGPDDDPLMQGSGSPALERYREERAAMARLDRLEREQKLLPRDEVRESMARIAAILRAAGDTIQRQFGTAAVEILYEALDDARREIDRSFGEAGNAPGSEPASNAK